MTHICYCGSKAWPIGMVWKCPSCDRWWLSDPARLVSWVLPNLGWRRISARKARKLIARGGLVYD